MVGERDLDAGVDVLRGEGLVAGHGDVAAGIVDLAGLVSPAGEHLVAALEPAAVLDLCKRLIFVAVFVGYRGGGSGDVGQRVDLALKDSLDGGVAVDGAVDVNGGAVLVYPLENGLARIGDLGLGILEHVHAGDDRADGDLVIGRGIVECGNLHRQRDGLLDPVREEGEVVRGHRLAGEVEALRSAGYLRRLDLVPAHEHCVLAEAFRTCRNIVVVAVQLSFIFYGVVRNGTVVVEGERVGLAHVVKVKRVVAEVFLVTVKTGNAGAVPIKAVYVMILFIVSSIIEVCLYFLVQTEVGSAGRPTAAVYSRSNILHIVIYGLEFVAVLIIEIKGCIEAGHTVERLECVVIFTAIGALPCTSVISRVERRLAKLGKNRSVIFCGYCSYGFVVAAKKFPCVLAESQCVAVAGEIDIQNAGAVGADGCRVGRAELEVLSVRHTVWQCAGGCIERYRAADLAGQSSGGQSGVIGIVRVLAPVDDHVLDIVAFPDGVEGGVSSGRNGGNNIGAVRSGAPALEAVAGAGGSFDAAEVKGIALSDGAGGYHAAAGGVEGDPVVVRSDRVDIGVCPDNGIGGECIVADDPAGDYLAIRLIVRRRGDLEAVGRVCDRGGVHLPVNGHKVHVEHGLELGHDLDFAAATVRGVRGAEVELLCLKLAGGINGIPAEELASTLDGGRRRSGELAVAVDDLCVEKRLPVIELESYMRIGRLDRIDGRDGCSAGGQSGLGFRAFCEGADRQQRHHHAQAQKQCKESFFHFCE